MGALVKWFQRETACLGRGARFRGVTRGVSWHVLFGVGVVIQGLGIGMVLRVHAPQDAHKQHATYSLFLFPMLDGSLA